MSLSARVARPVSLSGTVPSLNRLRSAAERVLSRWPDVVPDPPERDRERLVAEMKARLEQSRWDGARMSLVAAAARALFDEVRRDRPDLAPLRAFYLAETRATLRPTFLGAMVSVYLGSYVPGSVHTRALAAALRQARERLGARWRALIDQVPQILDPDAAPDAVARLMVGMKVPWIELRTLGLRSPHAPGLMDHVHLAYVGRLAPHLKQRSELEILFAWLKPESQAARISGASAAINAVLDHWRAGDPRPQDLSFITQSLIGFYGDPRVQRGGAWAGVPAELLAVVMRWLTGENIRFFLDVVSAVEDSHMWEPRRRFWLKLHEQRRIDAAWVAFSPDGANYARRTWPAHGSHGLQSFGRQTAGGSRAKTSLLILKIGSRIVIEGSHNYRVHIFRQSDRRAPELYAPAYDCEEIRRLPGAEAKSHLGDWQSWVEARI